MKFALVGSRETPDEPYKTICKYLAKAGHSMTSGSAPLGADMLAEQAFYEEGNTNCEIFIPWWKFGEGHPLRQCHIVPTTNTWNERVAIIKEIHPAFNRLTQGALKLHCRNVNQVLGANLDEPVDAVICWTKHGSITGGTATAIKVALKYGIPVFNIALENCIVELRNYILNRPYTSSYL